MKRLVFCAVTGLLLLAGCGPPLSVFPWFTEDSWVAAPELIGNWVADDDTFLRIAEVNGEKGLRATLRDGDECPAEFEIHTARLGDQLFWDLVPSDHQSHDANNDYLEYHTLRLHSFARVDVQGDRLRLLFMDTEWLAKRSEAGDLKIDHVMFDGKIPMLTAPSEQLQSFVLENAANPEAFPTEEGVMEFTRTK
jgi:hypothetical protein